MLSKLMKYDLKSMFKIFIPMWLALLVVSLVNRFTLSQSQFDAPQTLSMILYVFLFAAVIIVAVVLIIMRFYNGLLKDEGYLMFTLPVKPWQLVSSKCLSALIIIVLSLLVGTLSIFLIAFDQYMLMDLSRFFKEVFSYMNGEWVLLIVLSIVLLITAIAASVTHVYASLALGHLAPSHRIGWAVGAYIGINIFFTTITMIFGNIMNATHFDFDFQLESNVAMANLILGALIVLCVIQIALFFVTTERILSKKLNLE